MWDSYIYNNGKIDTYEPKWANNINTIQYRPNPETPINNLFIGGSYSNTTTGTYSMESACESGKNVSKTICKLDSKKENIYLYIKNKNFITYPIRYIDSIIYSRTWEVLIIIFIIILIIKTYRDK